MKRRLLMAPVAAALVAMMMVPAFAGSEVGDEAPVINSGGYLNNKLPVSWERLQGKVILLEAWATTWGPCIGQVPHLNRLNAEFESKGLVVIGVTNEGKGLVEPCVQKNNMEFLIGFGGGASGYATRGIPAAWLVGADGKILWKGHPNGLKKEVIEAALKDVQLYPTITTEGDFKKAGKLAKSLKFGSAITELQKLMGGTEEASTIATAQAAIDELTKYGQGAMKDVDLYAEGGYYVEAMTELKHLSTSFKGSLVGDTASEKLASWRKDKTVKRELDGAAVIAKATEQMNKARYKDAARTLASVAKNKKFDETKVQAKALSLYNMVMKKL